jgi:hypothetical protein
VTAGERAFHGERQHFPVIRHAPGEHEVRGPRKILGPAGAQSIRP